MPGHLRLGHRPVVHDLADGPLADPGLLRARRHGTRPWIATRTIEQRHSNVSQVWAWLGSYDLGYDAAGQFFDDVQAAVIPTLVEHTPAELGALMRTMSFYARITPTQRQALGRDYAAICQQLGRPIRSSTIGALVTARHYATPRYLG